MQCRCSKGPPLANRLTKRPRKLLLCTYHLGTPCIIAINLFVDLWMLQNCRRDPARSGIRHVTLSAPTRGVLFVCVPRINVTPRWNYIPLETVEYCADRMWWKGFCLALCLSYSQKKITIRLVIFSSTILIFHRFVTSTSPRAFSIRWATTVIDATAHSK